MILDIIIEMKCRFQIIYLDTSVIRYISVGYDEQNRYISNYIFSFPKKLSENGCTNITIAQPWSINRGRTHNSKRSVNLRHLLGHFIFPIVVSHDLGCACVWFFKTRLLMVLLHISRVVISCFTFLFWYGLWLLNMLVDEF